MSKAAWFFLLLLIALYTPFSGEEDLAVAHYFYDPMQQFSNAPWLAFIYDYGIIPAWIVVAAAAVALIFSFFNRSWQEWRRPALVLILTLGIGSGIIAHAILKEHWGRPRPKQVIEFGGTQAFRPYYSPQFHPPQPSKSFPCGHCSMGFFFFALMHLGAHYRHRRLYLIGFLLTLILGGVLSYARLAQGGHFLSDVLASALIMWLTSLLCCRVLLLRSDS